MPDHRTDPERPLPTARPDPAPSRARLDGQIRRLERLAARNGRRIAVRRGMRGLLGAGGGLAMAIKLKLAGSLALKFGLAAAVGLGLAFPAAALVTIAVVGTLAALLSCEGSVQVCDCPDGCARKEARRARLDRLLARKRARRDAFAEAGTDPGGTD